jgi:hypothetical protein
VRALFKTHNAPPPEFVLLVVDNCVLAMKTALVILPEELGRAIAPPQPSFLYCTVLFENKLSLTTRKIFSAAIAPPLPYVPVPGTMLFWKIQPLTTAVEEALISRAPPKPHDVEVALLAVKQHCWNVAKAFLVTDTAPPPPLRAELPVNAHPTKVACEKVVAETNPAVTAELLAKEQFENLPIAAVPVT